MGFNAIWISPIVENTPGGYHGYWMKDLWRINPHFGSEADLRELIQKCHQRDVWVMIDIVLNHVGNVDMDFWRINPFNKTEHYHKKCQIVDWNNQTQVEWCRLANLPDLAQENSFVNSQLSKFLLYLKNTLQADGFRLDTTPELFPWYLSSLENSIGDTYIAGEVLNGDVGYVCPYAELLGSVLSYPLFFSLRNVFQKGQSAFQIRSVLTQYAQKCKPQSEFFASFLDNHDQSRFLNEGTSKLQILRYMNALTFLIFHDEIPIIYYGTEQAFHGGNDPNNREYLGVVNMNEKSDLYFFISKLLSFKMQKHVLKDILEAPEIERYVLRDMYAFSRGKVMVVTVNEVDVKEIVTDYHPFGAGEEICDLISEHCRIVPKDRKIAIKVNNGMPVVYFPKME